MRMRVFNHVARVPWDIEFEPTDVPVGHFLRDAEKRIIGETDFDHIATISGSHLGYPSLNLPEQIPFLFRVRNANFYDFVYKILPSGNIRIFIDDSTIDVELRSLAGGDRIYGMKIDYDPTDAQDALDWAGVFGVDQLSESERERAISLVTKAWGEDWSSRSIVPIHIYESKWDIVRGEWIAPFRQNADFFCPTENSKCDEKTGFKSTIPLLTLEFDSDVNLGFGRDAFGVLLILKYCTVCKTFCVENR